MLHEVCPSCKIRGGLKRKLCECGYNVQKASSKNYWIEYYLVGKRTRERIVMSKQVAENRLREVQTAKAEGRTIRKNKNTIITLGSLREWYLDLSEVKQRRSFSSIKKCLRITIWICLKSALVVEWTMKSARERRKLVQCTRLLIKHSL